MNLNKEVKQATAAIEYNEPPTGRLSPIAVALKKVIPIAFSEDPDFSLQMTRKLSFEIEILVIFFISNRLIK